MSPTLHSYTCRKTIINTLKNYSRCEFQTTSITIDPPADHPLRDRGHTYHILLIIDSRLYNYSLRLTITTNRNAIRDMYITDDSSKNVGGAVFCRARPKFAARPASRLKLSTRGGWKRIGKIRKRSSFGAKQEDDRIFWARDQWSYPSITAR